MTKNPVHIFCGPCYLFIHYLWY